MCACKSGCIVLEYATGQGCDLAFGRVVVRVCMCLEGCCFYGKGVKSKGVKL